MSYGLNIDTRVDEIVTGKAPSDRKVLSWERFSPYQGADAGIFKRGGREEGRGWRRGEGGGRRGEGGGRRREGGGAVSNFQPRPLATYEY